MSSLKAIINKIISTAESNQLREHQEEISILRNIVYRLNAELNDYQIKYPSPSLQKSIKVMEWF